MKLQQKCCSAGQIVTTGKSQFYLESVVGPAPKLHLTALVVEGEPGDVDLAGGLEHAGRDIGAEAGARHHDVCGERRVKALAGAVTQRLGVKNGIRRPRRLPIVHQNVRSPDYVWRESEVFHIAVLRLIPPRGVRQGRINAEFKATFLYSLFITVAFLCFWCIFNQIFTRICPSINDDKKCISR